MAGDIRIRVGVDGAKRSAQDLDDVRDNIEKVGTESEETEKRSRKLDQLEQRLADLDSASGKTAEAFAGMAAGVGLATAGAFAVGFAENLQIDAGQDKIAAQLRLTAEESERIGKVAGDLYADAYGDSLDEVNSAIRGVHSNIGELGSFSDEQLSTMSAKALDLATTMEEDVSRVTRAAGQLMRNGLARDADHAFDILAAGSAAVGEDMQGELIDTIEEYGADLASLGIDGEQALGALAGAVENGARNVDLAADAFREFSIRAIDGSDLTAQAMTDLGFDADKMADKIAGGGPAAADATSEIIRALSDVTDPVAQEAAGVALFGTRFEELGAGAIAAMDPLASGLDNVEGAAGDLGDTLNDNLATRLTELKRGAMQRLTEFIDNTLLPGIDAGEDAFGRLAGWVQENQTVLTVLGTLILGFFMPALVGMGAAAVVQGARVVISWALSAAAGTASMIAQTAAAWATVAGWVAMGAQAVLNGARIAAAWVVAMGPVGWIITIIAGLVAAFVWAYNNVDWFRDGVDQAMRGVQRTVDWIKGIITRQFDAISTIFTGVKDLVVGIFTGDFDLAAEGAKKIIDGFKDHIGTVVGVITGIWNGLKEAFAGPVRWVAEHAINPFIRMLNKIPGVNLGEVEVPKFADGGRVPGQTDRTGADDVLARLTRGEWVMPVDARLKYGDEFMRDVQLGRYREGGIVDVGRAIQGLGARVTEHPAFGGVQGRHAPGGDHYKNVSGTGGDAIDINYGPGGENATEKRFMDSTLVPWIRANVSGFRQLLWRVKDHFNHAHLGGGNMQLAPGAGGQEEGGGRSILGRLTDFVTAPVRKAVQWITDKVAGGLPDNDGVGGLLAGVVKNVLNPAKLIEAINPFGGGGDMAAPGVGDAVGRWAPVVGQALGMLGQSDGLIPWVLQLIRHESGGNPRAINLTDINAQRGDPSKGLIQTIGATFAAYRHPDLPNDPYHPLANIFAGLNYGIDRYGSIANIPGIKALMAGRAYKPYADGGLLHGTGLVGEDGPELISSRTRPLRITDADTTAALRGGTTISIGSITIKVEGRGPEEDDETFARRIADALAEAFADPDVIGRLDRGIKIVAGAS